MPDKQAHLLVALLLRYPEIGSVRVLPSASFLNLSFFFRAQPEEADFDRFRSRVVQALGLLSRLEGGTDLRQVFMSLRTQGPLWVLDIRRDLSSLVVEEFAIVLGMVVQAFGNLLVIEKDSDGGEAMIFEDDSDIAQGLSQARTMQHGEELIGFRHDGRVLVFSSV